MHRAGRERVVDALLSAPRISARGFILMMPEIDRKVQREKIFKIYVSDALKIIGGLNIRYKDIIKPQVEDERTEKEVKAHICDTLERMEAKGQ